MQLAYEMKGFVSLDVFVGIGKPTSFKFKLKSDYGLVFYNTHISKLDVKKITLLNYNPSAIH